MEISKRARTANYTQAERLIYVKLFQKYPILLNKRTDGFTMKAKDSAWEQLRQEFNTTCSSDRTIKQIKILYENIRQKAKKKVAGKIHSKLDSAEEMMLGLVQRQLKPLHNDDAVYASEGAEAVQSVKAFDELRAEPFQAPIEMVSNLALTVGRGPGSSSESDEVVAVPLKQEYISTQFCIDITPETYCDTSTSSATLVPAVIHAASVPPTTPISAVNLARSIPGTTLKTYRPTSPETLVTVCTSTPSTSVLAATPTSVPVINFTSVLAATPTTSDLAVTPATSTTAVYSTSVPAATPTSISAVTPTTSVLAATSQKKICKPNRKHPRDIEIDSAHKVELHNAYLEAAKFAQQAQLAKLEYYRAIKEVKVKYYEKKMERLNESCERSDISEEDD